MYRHARSGGQGVGSVVWRRRCLWVPLAGSFPPSEWNAQGQHQCQDISHSRTYWCRRGEGPWYQSGSSAKAMMEFLSIEIFWSVNSRIQPIGFPCFVLAKVLNNSEPLDKKKKNGVAVPSSHSSTQRYYIAKFFTKSEKYTSTLFHSERKKGKKILDM